jgi:hypothetical protein
VGWKHDTLITKLESKRKDKSAQYYKQKLLLAGLRRKAEANVASKVSDINKKLQELGHVLKPKEKVEVVAAKKAAASAGGGKKKAAAAADDDE